MFVHSPQVLARHGESPLEGSSSAAVGIGMEVSHGDYGVGADATLVKLPLSIYFRPANSLDISLEIPLLHLSGKWDSGLVATSSGAGFGRGPGRQAKAANSAKTMHESGVGDINMTAGWTWLEEGGGTPKFRPTFYVKVPSGDTKRGLGTGTLEAGPGFSLSKWLDNVQVFVEGSYLLQDSKAEYPGRNYASYLAGLGLQAGDRWFISLLAEGSSSRSEGAGGQAEGLIKLSFTKSRRVLWEIYGSLGFTDASPAYGAGMMMVYQF